MHLTRPTRAGTPASTHCKDNHGPHRSTDAPAHHPGDGAERYGAHAVGFEHSLWALLEHLRLAQKDIYDFCANADYVHALEWPADYWPKSAAPASAKGP